MSSVQLGRVEGASWGAGRAQGLHSGRWLEELFGYSHLPVVELARCVGWPAVMLGADPVASAALALVTRQLMAGGYEAGRLAPPRTFNEGIGQMNCDPTEIRGRMEGLVVGLRELWQREAA